MEAQLEPGGQSSAAARARAGGTEYRHLLVRGVNWLGDAVMTTPAMQRLRERFPDAHISLLTEEKLVGLWQGHAGVDSVLTFKDGDSPWAVARRLRGQPFEAALILPNSHRSALEIWLAKVPCRIGYTARWRNWLLTRPVEYPSNRARLRRLGVGAVKRRIGTVNAAQEATRRGAYVHQMHDYLGLAAALNSDSTPLRPRLDVSAGEIEAALANCVWQPRGHPAAGADGRSGFYLGLNPAAAYGPAKRWPIERFAQVTREISQRFINCTWLVFGSRSDWELCEKLTQSGAGRMINLAGKTTLRQLMALLKASRALLTNDSGPMHVAAALGTPVVAIFGSTSPELTGPGLPGEPRHHLLRSDVPCSPCFRRTCPIDFRCMNGVTASQAVTAVLESLAEIRT